MFVKWQNLFQEQSKIIGRYFFEVYKLINLCWFVWSHFYFSLVSDLTIINFTRMMLLSLLRNGVSQPLIGSHLPQARVMVSGRWAGGSKAPLGHSWLWRRAVHTSHSSSQWLHIHKWALDMESTTRTLLKHLRLTNQYDGSRWHVFALTKVTRANSYIWTENTYKKCCN